MERPAQDELTDLIHRQLMKLPERNAPETLIPRVLHRIERRQRCWWQRPWGTWPFSAKLLSLPLLLGCAGVCFFVPSLLARLTWGESIPTQASALLRPLVPMWDLFLTVGKAVVLVLQSLEQPWVLAAAGVVFLMYLTGLAAGTVCFRVVRSSGRLK